MPKYVEVSLEEYRRCTVLSYTGGATWLRVPWLNGEFYVIPGSPIEIKRDLEKNAEVIARVV